MKNLKIKPSMKHRKTIEKKGFLLIFFCTLLSISLIAGERSSSISLTAKSNNSILLELPGNIDSQFTISIYDKKSFNIHHEVLQGDTKARSYNLQNLPSGEYVFEISFNETKKWKHIQIESGTLQTIDESFQMIIKPSVKLHRGYLDLNLLCFSDSKISLSIWDEDGHLLLEDFLTANGAIQRRYNLLSLEKGEYHLHISTTEPSINFEFSTTVKVKS